MEFHDVLTSVGNEIQANKVEKGWKITGPDAWKDSYEIPAVLMLITTEVAEAMEAFRKDDFENFKDELADVFIRTVGLAHGMQIDLAAAVEAKLEKNKTRPYKHGGKRL